MAFSFNKSTPATGAEAIFNLKTLLKLQGWTVQSSSDGTTYNASGDQISSAGSGAGGMANNSAWFRIRSPAGAGSQEFTCQRGTTNLVWRIKRSRTAGFTGGSPGTTQTPSATDELIAIGAGTDASPTFSSLFAADGTYRWNCASDGASPYGWWAVAFPTGGGAPQAVLILDPLLDTTATDADIYIFLVGVSGQSQLSLAALQNEAGAATSRAAWSQIISASPGSSYVHWPTCRYATGSGDVSPNALPTNPINAKDERFPAIYARRSALANPGFKGQSSLLRWTGTSRTTGDTLTVSTTRDRIVMADISLPWDGTVPSV
jgi:hypothetical protein